MSHIYYDSVTFEFPSRSVTAGGYNFVAGMQIVAGRGNANTLDVHGNLIIDNAPADNGLTYYVNVNGTRVFTDSPPHESDAGYLGWSTLINIGAAGGTRTLTVTDPFGTYTVNANYLPVYYDVTYNANGGRNAPADQEKAHGTPLILSYTKPIREGYTFRGWATSPGGQPVYIAGSSYGIDADVTLYAVWELITHNVFYNANGGINAPEMQIKRYGQTLYISTITPTRAGYTFDKWNTYAAGYGTDYTPGSEYNVDADVTLYAQWDRITYAVTYNANGGTGAPLPQEKSWGVNLTLSTTIPERAGYAFKGWAKSPTGSVVFSPGAQYIDDAPLALYAVWQIKSYTIKYSANGGAGTPAQQTKTHGQALRLSAEKPIRQDYNFLGWNTKPDGSGTNYQLGAMYTADESVTLYANWEILKYSIFYNANGGTGAPPTQKAGVNTYTALSDVIPVRADETGTFVVTYNKVNPEATISKNSDTVTVEIAHTFSRWNTRPDGTGQSYYPGQSFKVPEQNTTLYAIYTSVYTGSTSLPTGTLTQWEIAFWADSLTDPELHKVTDPYTPKQSITLYAIWAPIGTGGYLKFESDTGIPGIGQGSKIYIDGFHNPNNDGPKTVESYSFHDGIVEMIFVEDFVYGGQQDTAFENLHIYGEGNIVPNFDYICSLNNRLWGCNSSTRIIYGSALGDPTDFWTFAGDALDAFQVAAGSDGKFTGAVAMNNSVVFLKQHTVHKILGSFPAEYALYTYDMDGTSDTNGLSAINCDGTVIYVTEHGIGTYSGSAAGRLSKELGEGNMNNAIAMYNGEQYYLHFQTDDGKNKTYIFDLRYNMWIEAKYQEALAFAHMDDQDYVLFRSDDPMSVGIRETNGRTIWDSLTSADNLQICSGEDVLWDQSVDGGSGNIEIHALEDETLWPTELPHGTIYRIDSGQAYDDDWEILFKPFYEDVTSRYSKSHVFEKKRYTGITFRMELPKGSWIRAEIKSDDGRWIPVARQHGRKDRVLDFVVKTPRVDKVQLRLTGHGPMTILSMEREYTTGSRR